MSKHPALGDLDQELRSTRRMLERLPEHRFDWRPHERSWTLGELATHVANLVGWQTQILATDRFDLATDVTRSGAFESSAALLARFDENVAALRAALAGAPDDALGAPWTLQRGEQVLFTLPRLAALRSMGLNHLIHHRGQLSVYLRLLDVPVPGLYGPSADERAA
jgi:uncharacterized damage-inducible protein DinB